MKGSTHSCELESISDLKPGGQDAPTVRERQARLSPASIRGTGQIVPSSCMMAMTFPSES